MSGFTPVNQVRLTNVAYVRLQKAGKRFEIACYRNKALSWRNKVEHDLSEVLQIDTVFSNVSKGMLASSKDLEAAFGTSDQREVCREILDRGELQVSEQERSAQHESLFREVANIVVEKTVDSETNLPFTTSIIQNAMREIQYSVNLTKSAKSQALDVIRRLKGIMPIARVKMSLRAICLQQDASSVIDLLRNLGAVLKAHHASAVQQSASGNSISADSSSSSSSSSSNNNSSSGGIAKDRMAKGGNSFIDFLLDPEAYRTLQNSMEKQFPGQCRIEVLQIYAHGGGETNVGIVPASRTITNSSTSTAANSASPPPPSSSGSETTGKLDSAGAISAATATATASTITGGDKKLQALINSVAGMDLGITHEEEDDQEGERNEGHVGSAGETTSSVRPLSAKERKKLKKRQQKQNQQTHREEQQEQASRADSPNDTDSDANEDANDSRSATGSSATGSSATGSSATGSSATGSSATGSSAAGGSATGGSAAGSSATGSSAAGGSATGSSATGNSVTGESSSAPVNSAPVTSGGGKLSKRAKRFQKEDQRERQQRMAAAHERRQKKQLTLQQRKLSSPADEHIAQNDTNPQGELLRSNSPEISSAAIESKDPRSDGAGTTQSCNTCGGHFPNANAYRQHFRSDWHRHNLSRKLQGQDAVSEAEFEQLLQESGGLLIA